MWDLLAFPNALGGAAARRVSASGRGAVALAEVLSRTAAGAAHAPPGGRRLVARTTVMQVYFTGVQSVPVAGFFGLIVGLGFGHLVERSGFFLLVPIGQDVIIEQLGVFVAALAVVARSAPAVAVELGNMKVGGELRMLESFGIDPYRHLALPRVLGIVLGVTALGFLVTGIALAALYFIVHTHPEYGGSNFWFAVRPDQAVRVGLTGIASGLAVALVAVHQGFALAPMHTEVPKAASRAVVRSLVLCALVSLVIGLVAG